jgi:predicted RNA binding protein YcfA (HicA-like mRNA interferase family)
MKRRELETRLAKQGWRLERHGGSHDLWTDGTRSLAVPRHREIAGRIARARLTRASDAGKSRAEV